MIRDGNKLTNLNGNLAGSVLDMAGAVSYAVKELGLELSEAVRMASLYPAEFLGISAERGQIKVGAKADLVLLNDNGLVQQCWLAGYPLWNSKISNKFNIIIIKATGRNDGNDS